MPDRARRSLHRRDARSRSARRRLQAVHRRPHPGRLHQRPDPRGARPAARVRQPDGRARRTALLLHAPVLTWSALRWACNEHNAWTIPPDSILLTTTFHATHALETDGLAFAATVGGHSLAGTIVANLREPTMPRPVPERREILAPIGRAIADLGTANVTAMILLVLALVTISVRSMRRSTHPA